MFEVHQDALQVFRAVEGQIGVVSVCGLKAAGKSFLLNILLDKFQGSGVSDHFPLTIQIVQNQQQARREQSVVPEGAAAVEDRHPGHLAVGRADPD